VEVRLPGIGTSRSPARTTRAALFAIVAVALVAALRARSDGPRPDLLILVAATVVTALVARPLTGRERRLPALVGGLVAVQLVLRSSFLLASTGHLAHGSTGLFCSPAAANSPSCLPTDRGGIALLAVQLIAGVAVAIWLRDVEAVTWTLARIFGRGVARVTTAVWAALVALVAFIGVALTSAPAPVSPARTRRSAPDATRLRLALFSRALGRRGPPTAPALRTRAGSRSRAVTRRRTAFTPALDAALLS
jgi:hypothetical protein